MKFPRSFQTIVLTLVVVGLLLLAVSGYLTPLTRLAYAPFISLQTWFSGRYLAVQKLLNTPRDVALLAQENARLNAEVARLQGQIIELQQQNVELQVLSALLDFAQTYPENEYASAAVIGRDVSPFLHYVIINRGSDAGLRRGMPVVSQEGLVGRVAAVTAGAARVQLLTDPDVSITVHLKNANVEAILSGSLTGELTLNQIPQQALALAGEVLLTSGLGGNYPPNIPVGQITSVRQRPFDLFQSASVQAVTDFSQMEIVLVIINFRPIDISPLVPTPVP
jgi:rod shape-determining protein MreC